MNKFKGFLSLLLAGFIFGSFGIWIRILNQELTTYQQIFFRGTVGFIFALLLAYFLKNKFSLNKVNKIILFIYFLSFPLATIFFVTSILNEKIAVTTFSFYASGIIGSLCIGMIFFREKLTRIKLFSLILVIAGVILLSYPLSIKTVSFGFLMGLLGGLFDAASNALRKFLTGKIDRFVLVAIQLSGIMIVAFGFLIFNRQPIFSPMSGIAIIVGVLFGGLLVSITFLTLIGFQNYDLNLGMIVLSSELIFAPIFAALAFHEYPSAMEIGGGLLIVASIVVSNLSFEKK